SQQAGTVRHVTRDGIEPQLRDVGDKDETAAGCGGIADKLLNAFLHQRDRGRAADPSRGRRDGLGDPKPRARQDDQLDLGMVSEQLEAARAPVRAQFPVVWRRRSNIAVDAATERRRTDSVEKERLWKTLHSGLDNRCYVLGVTITPEDSPRCGRVPRC